jgi:hypothetical protein
MKARHGDLFYDLQANYCDLFIDVLIEETLNHCDELKLMN